MKPLPLILCLLCMAPVTRKGAETLMLLAKKGARQKALEAQMKAVNAIPTKAPMPPTDLRAIIPPRGASTNIYLTFKYNDTGLDARSNCVFQVAWTTNLPAAQHTTTFMGNTNSTYWPRGWTHYVWTAQLTNTFRNTNQQAYFILRASNTVTHWVSPWVTK